MATLTLSGTLGGSIWMPNTKATMPINVNLSREIRRFTEKPTLRELLLSILAEKGGDFQSAEFVEGTITATTYRANRRIQRFFDLRRFPSIADLMVPESEVDDFAFCDYDDCDD